MLVGYEENVGTRVYRLYNPEKRKLILSRDVIIDESSATHSKVSETATIEWDNGVLPVPVPAQGTKIEHDGFLPLETIVPQAGPVAERDGILDSITVRPRLATEPLLPEGQVKISEKDRQTERQSRSKESEGQIVQWILRPNSHFSPAKT